MTTGANSHAGEGSCKPLAVKGGSGGPREPPMFQGVNASDVDDSVLDALPPEIAADLRRQIQLADRSSKKGIGAATNVGVPWLWLCVCCVCFEPDLLCLCCLTLSGNFSLRKRWKCSLGDVQTQGQAHGHSYHQAQKAARRKRNRVLFWQAGGACRVMTRADFKWCRHLCFELGVGNGTRLPERLLAR